MRTLRPQNPGYGQGVHAITSSQTNAVLQDPRDVAERVRTLFAAPDYRPPMLPAAAMEVHRLSMQRDVDFGAIVTVLESDPVLASETLRIAQSPMFARAVPPSSLQDAVARLGMGNVRDIVLRAAMGSKIFRSKQYGSVMENARRHSVATGVVARLLASGSPVGEYAYMCGLMHDVGAAAVILALSEAGREVALEPLGVVVEQLHEEAGRMLLEAWKLPDQLVGAVAGHHRPESKEGALALVAHTVASREGFGLMIGGDAEPERPARTSDACKMLRLSPEGLDRLQAKARDALATL